MRKLKPLEEDSELKNKNEPSSELIVDSKNEQLLIGQALNDKKCLSLLVSNINWKNFLILNHQVLVWCLNKAFDENLEISDDVFDVLRIKFPGKSKVTGGYKYIKNLRESYSGDIVVSSYGVHLQKLKIDFLKYKIANEYIVDLMKIVYNPMKDIDDILQYSVRLDDLIRENYNIKIRGFQTMEEINECHDIEIKKRSKISGFVSTGFRWLDKSLTDGFAPGKITIIGGRPGSAKSAFVANSMVRLSNKIPNPIPSALFALEMDTISMVDRMNAIQTDIPLIKLIKERNNLSREEKKAERTVKERRSKKPIYICDDVRKSLTEIKRELRILKEKNNVKVCFIDLFMKLKKISYTGNKSTADQYTEMLNEVQRIARELDIHIVLVVQIGRKVESRIDKRPVISDLKDSGAYEEVADNIFLFYREAYYLQRDIGHQFDFDILEIIIGKQRQGQTGTVYAKFKGEITKIQNSTPAELNAFKGKLESIKGKNKKKRNFSN